MFRTTTIGIILCLLITGTHGIDFAHAASQTVVINELMWMGSSSSSADEWIELRNTTDAAIDMSGWVITKRTNGNDVVMVTMPNQSSIPPRGYFLVSNYAPTNTNSQLVTTPNLVTTDVALSNTGLFVQLLDASATIVDVADDGSGVPLSGSYDSTKKFYASMERNPQPGDGTLASSWHTATRSTGWKPGSADLGTPGAENSNGVPIANAGPDQTGVVGQEMNFDGSDSSDPEQRQLTYAWDFGDGSTGTEPTPKHTFTSVGTFSVHLVVSDGVDQATDASTVTITAPPTMKRTEPAPSVELDVAESPTSCRGLIITEVFPNPKGVDTEEFIELRNSGDEDVAFTGCSIRISGTKRYTSTDNTPILRGSFIVVKKTQSKLTLNNGGASVALFDVNGEILDTVTYGTAPEAQSWSLDRGTWHWTTRTTPGTDNTIVAPPLQKSAVTTGTKISKKTSPPTPAAVEVSLDGVQQLDSGDRVRIQGTVTVVRDVLGSTMVYLDDGHNGVSISVPNGEPTVALGQTLAITGTVRLKNGRRYVAVVTKGLRVIGSASLSEVPLMATDDVGIDQADRLIHVKGVASLVSGNRIAIDDGSGPVIVYLKSSTGIVRPKVKAGDTVDVTGIVNTTTSGIRILPRQQNDLRVEHVLGASTVTPVPAQIPSATPQQSLRYWTLVALAAIGASIRPWLQWRKKKKTTQGESSNGNASVNER